MTPDIRKERETALYEAALRLIAKGVNPAAMKVQQIADEAGIGKGTVYEYFASKDEILQGEWPCTALIPRLPALPY